jgi:hypothetical protein
MDPNEKSLLLKDIDDIRTLLGALKNPAQPRSNKRVLYIF